jgi:hypothetical protein
MNKSPTLPTPPVGAALPASTGEAPEGNEKNGIA